MIRAGLFLYDHLDLGKRKLLPGSSGVRLRDHPAGEALDPRLVRGFEYSDTGYLVLGRLIEAATGRRYYDLLDERIVTLDAAAERVERPNARLPLGGRIQAFSMLRDFTVQACFVDGAVCNVDERSVEDWVELLAELRPRAVQVYTIDRPARTQGVRPASPPQLEAISRRLRDETGIPVHLAG